jgi:hypothetical protein
LDNEIQISKKLFYINNLEESSLFQAGFLYIKTAPAGAVLSEVSTLMLAPL